MADYNVAPAPSALAAGGRRSPRNSCARLVGSIRLRAIGGSMLHSVNNGRPCLSRFSGTRMPHRRQHLARLHGTPITACAGHRSRIAAKLSMREPNSQASQLLERRDLSVAGDGKHCAGGQRQFGNGWSAPKAAPVGRQLPLRQLSPAWRSAALLACAIRNPTVGVRLAAGAHRTAAKSTAFVPA